RGHGRVRLPGKRHPRARRRLPVRRLLHRGHDRLGAAGREDRRQEGARDEAPIDRVVRRGPERRAIRAVARGDRLQDRARLAGARGSRGRPSGARTVEPITRGGLLMRSVTYSMGMSLDGYIVGPDGTFDWTPPDPEVFRFWIDEIREVGVHLLGRRLYETMLYWETADQDPSLDDAELEWAALWKPLPKVVFSTTLPAVEGNARLASGGLAEEIERLRAEPGEGDIASGGATLAAEAAAVGRIDEYRPRVYAGRG